MTTMASTKSISIYYADDLCRAEKRNVGIFKLGFSRLGVPGIVREKLVVQANLGGSSKSVDMINGKKVNGVVPSSGARGGEVMKQGGVHEPVHAWLMGTFVEDRFVYRQTFVIRSYEIGPDKTATMETLMNLLQETALNHVTSSGLAGNGFGATREMSLRKLIWVVTRIHVQVDKYSSWGDVVEIDTWVDAAGKNGMRRDWIIRDRNSQRIITRATSTWVIMNRETRRLSKIPDEVRKEVQPFYLDRVAIPTADLDCEKINKLNDETADRIRSGLASVPIDVLEDYNLTSMTLEYRRECRQSNVLESLTTMAPKMSEDSNKWTDKTRQELESTHLLRMQADKAEIVRARSVWQSKHKHMI
ncbi:fatty acyl-ACP thioesterases B [Actinidia rufa]|uniref:Acyl-[acyl-carrier-protein] hydrolase n=1 Tax=Actinidia rufa TaxID=165716 RepID=A0A7J0FYX9_9ERIC|nr:fatty acyl-ACP thioesterases B [Actinidia rufa]